MALRHPIVLALASLAGAGCSSTFTPLPCASDSDCGGGLVCGDLACVAAADAPLVAGISARRAFDNAYREFLELVAKLGQKKKGQK